jgi:glycosyltransferase involved in cell wall biosynthesis
MILEKSRPVVSVIVPTRNSASTLEVCLKSIKNQTYPNLEVIVVDNYSTDGSRKIAEKYAVALFVHGSERSSQRNYAAKRAHGAYIFFVDSDMEIPPKTVDVCVRKMNGNEALILPEETVGETFWARVLALERITYFGDMLFEAARFFKRNVFERSGGYDEEIIGAEDCDLQAKLEKNRRRVGYVAATIIHHEKELGLKDNLMKRYYYVKNSKKYLKEHPRRAIAQFAPVKRSYLRHWRLMLENPSYTAGLALFRVFDAVIFMAGLISA